MKVSIIGAGRVGGLIGFELMNRELAEELVFIDVFKDLAEAQAEDIRHSIPPASYAEVYSGNYSDAKKSDFVIVAAGKPRTPDIKTRLDLANLNAPIVADIARQVAKHSPNAVAVLLSNPMDVMNHIFWKASGFDRFRVIGSGGELDSSRLRTIIAGRAKVPASAVEAMVLGEHGDGQVPLFSRVKVFGKHFKFSKRDCAEISKEAGDSGNAVIKGKSCTEFGPANATLRMLEAMINGDRKVMACSVVLDGEYGLGNVSVGVPVVLGHDGVEEVLEWNLPDSEKNAFDDAAAKLSGYCRSCEKLVGMK